MGEHSQKPPSETVILPQRSVWQRLDKMWDVYFPTTMLMCFALFALSSLFERVPTEQDLKAIDSQVATYRLYYREPGHRRGLGRLVDYFIEDKDKTNNVEESTVIVALQNGLSFWAYTLDPTTVANTVKSGMAVRVYVDTNTTDTPLDGDAVEAFGLWLDGKELESTTSSLERLNSWGHKLFSVGMATIFLLMAVYAYRVSKRNT